MVEILIANPQMEGIVADIPSVIQQTKELIKTKGIEDRCQTMECDFFKNIPSGSDAYLLSNILHDWPDKQCQIILNNYHRVMKAESRLLVLEVVVPRGNESSVAKLLDLEMLVTTGGRERTEAEFKQLFKSTGFKLSCMIHTKDNVCIIEGIKE